MGYSKSSKQWILSNKKSRGIPLTDEELEWERELYQPKEKKPRKELEWERELYQPKEKKPRKERAKETEAAKRKRRAKYAIEKRAEALEKPKWMQKWIDFSDPSLPLGKRRVAYVRYLMMYKKLDLNTAKRLSIRNIN